MRIFYRISDSGYKKIKPNYIDNEKCLKNFTSIFNIYVNKFTVIADNISDNTYNMIRRYVSDSQIIKVSIGHGSGTFNLALDMALQISDYNDIIYFVENDYLHKPKSDLVLLDGFRLEADFVTLYDHPDKYLDPSIGGNPYCGGGSEITRVYLGQLSHWKLTNSTTMTFATKVKTLHKSEHIIRKWTLTNHPYDFDMFVELHKNNYTLISPIPGYATHGETNWLCPLTNWSII